MHKIAWENPKINKTEGATRDFTNKIQYDV